MKKHKVGAAVVVLITCASVLYCYISQNRLIRSIQNAVEAAKEGANPILVMSSLTDFEWDQLIIIAPYTSAESINARLGYPWLEPNDMTFSASEGENSLVFLRNGRVVRYYKLGRFIDFSNLGSRRVFVPGQDAFRIEVKASIPGEPTRADLVPVGVPDQSKGLTERTYVELAGDSVARCHREMI